MQKSGRKFLVVVAVACCSLFDVVAVPVAVVCCSLFVVVANVVVVVEERDPPIYILFMYNNSRSTALAAVML